MNNTIFITAIALMAYGILQHVLTDGDFWFYPIGNIIGAIAVSVVMGATLPITLQDDVIILVVTALVLYWVTKGKRTRRPVPATPTGKQTFDQVFTTVAVDEPVAAVVDQMIDDDEPDDEPAPAPTAPAGVFTWNGR